MNIAVSDSVNIAVSDSVNIAVFDNQAMDQERKQAEALCALYLRDKLDLYARIAECDKKLAKFEQFLKFLDLIDKDMDKDDQKKAAEILQKYSTFKQAAIQEQAESIAKKTESSGWFGSWWGSGAQAPPPTPSQDTDEFVILKEKIKIVEDSAGSTDAHK